MSHGTTAKQNTAVKAVELLRDQLESLYRHWSSSTQCHCCRSIDLALRSSNADQISPLFTSPLLLNAIFSSGQEPLTKRAFNAYLNDRCALREGNLEACKCRAENNFQTCYFTKDTDIGLHSRAPRYSFSHRIFQGFLVVLHLQKMARKTTLEWLQGASVALNETTFQFLLGMLHGKNLLNLLALARVVVRKMRFCPPVNQQSCARELHAIHQ
ncbi:hypothetical protein CAPTEDRAFT_201259 [Capitella teleta]|uniref:Uncharacterized protein n=1 Tax=Capitella teleta TaxID=283909 RepID=R7UVK6_CAPTE|nr:hypothetical protein CAPTEDRAFT_201259 [Capitella teleta]|eukprot:ELU10282.1 hypothetical protein CAPTEDRAFT_201259 [Capitella teleta]